MSFPPYASYKDSGVEWLGEVPSHWRVERLKLSVENCRNGIWGQEADGGPDDIPCVRVADFDRVRLEVKLEEPTIRSVSERERQGRLLRPGDLLLEKSGGGEKQPVGAVVLYGHPEPAVCSNFVARMRLAPEMHARFWTYVHSAAYAVRLTDRSINQTSGIQNLDQSAYFEEPAPYPTLGEQAAIAEFLDRETAKIDVLVEAQRRLVALLKEKRQAVISHAVTKGLDLSAPLKSSGIPWLGDVPAHWEVRVLKRDLAFLTSGSRGWADHYADEGALFIRIGNLTRDGIDLDLNDLQRVAVPSGSEGERTKVEAGDLLVSITAYLGSVAVAPPDLEAAFVSQHVALARLKAGGRLFPRWAAFVAISYVGRTYLENQGYGGTKIQLALDDVAEMLMTAPPLAEQATILAQIDAELGQLSDLLVRSEQSITLLTERRAALISAAVTGKLDVRGLAAQPQPAEAA